MKPLKGFMNTLNPKGGQGLSESILLGILIVGIFVLSYFGKEIPEIIKMIVYALVGAVWGYKSKQNEPKEREGEGDL